MDFKLLFKALAVKAKQHKSVGKKFAKSYVSLFLVFMLAATSAVAWFTQKQTASISANNLEFQSASSLRINKEQNASNIITIDQCVLDEASSTDGRNIYFPLGESFTANADNMQFREGNTGDENIRYVYKDFKLNGSSGNTPVYIKSYEVKVEEADVPHDTEVNATYHDHLEIEYESYDSEGNPTGKPLSQSLPPDHCPIRLAFIADSGQKPVVIDPSAQVVDYVDNSVNAVSLIDENGKPTTVNTYNNSNNWNSFASYYYGNSPLFVIPGGQTLNVTLVVWLEGSLEDSDKYIGKKISVDVDIESNFPVMDTITFYDDTKADDGNTAAEYQHWVSKDDPIVACAYKDPYSTENRWKTVIMRKTADYTWQAKIPKKAVKNISFYRLSRENDSSQGTIYNAWHTNDYVMSWRNTSIDSWLEGVDLQSTRQYTADGNTYNALVYTAIHGNGYGQVTTSTDKYKIKRLSPCVGYWNYSGGSSSGGSSSGGSSSGGGSGTGTGGEADYSITVNVDTSNKPWIENNVNKANGDRLWFWTNNGNFELSRRGSNSFSWSGKLKANDEIIGFYITNHNGDGYCDFNVTATYTVTKNYNVNYSINNDQVMVLNN